MFFFELQLRSLVGLIDSGSHVLFFLWLFFSVRFFWGTSLNQQKPRVVKSINLDNIPLVVKMMLISFRPNLAIRNSLQSQISFEAGLLKYHCHFCWVQRCQECMPFIYIRRYKYSCFRDLYICYLSPVTRWKLLCWNSVIFPSSTTSPR